MNYWLSDPDKMFSACYDSLIDGAPTFESLCSIIVLVYVRRDAS